MKLFKLEIARGRRGKDVIVWARSRAAAERRIAEKFQSWKVERVTELPKRVIHFQIADFDLV